MRLGSIILAGGRSRRMGQPKESLPFGSSTLLGRTVDTLLSCSAPVIVVTRDAAQPLPTIATEANIVHDDRIDDGPLRGLQSGLRHAAASCDAVFLTGCDSPFLSVAAIDWLFSQLGDDDVVMPKLGQHLQPLAAVYRTSVLDRVSQLLEDGTRTLRAMADACRTRVLTEVEVDAFDPERSFLQNVNSPERYAEAVAKLATELGGES